MKRMTLAFGLLAGGLSTSAGAVTINFDSIPAGPALSNEFVGVGVVFTGIFAVTNSTFGGAVTIPSPPNFIQLGGTSTIDFVDPAHPNAPATTDFISVVNPALSGGCFNAIRIDAFDVSGVLLNTVTIPAVASSSQQSTTSLSAVDIASVDMTNLGGDCITAFDDLTFDAVVPVGIFSDSFESPVATAATSD